MAAVSVAVEGFRHKFGEGPHWDPATKQLLSVDYNVGVVHRWSAKTGTKEQVQLPGDEPVGFIVPRESGGYVCGRGQKILHLDWDTETLIPLADVSSLQHDARFNDGKCDSRGRLWAGTVRKGGPPPARWEEVPPPGGLYCLGLDGVLREHARGFGFTNGLAWSSDDSRLFFVDTFSRQIWAFDYDIDTGDVSNKRVVVDVGEANPSDPKFHEYGYLDGCCMDADDKLWLACYFSDNMFRFDLEKGVAIERIKMPVNRLTSCCFGGGEMDVLYVTTTQSTITTDAMDQHPLDGSILKITGLGTRGTPATMYRG